VGLLLALASWGCGESEQMVGSVAVAARYERSILRSEAVAHRIQSAVTHGLVGLETDDASAFRSLIGVNFSGRLPGPEAGRVLPDDLFEVRVVELAGEEQLDGDGFTRRLQKHLTGWSTIERREFEMDRFFLNIDGERADGRAELYLAGERKGGGRTDLRLRFEAAFARVDETWIVTRLDLLDGIAISSDAARFADITDAAGLHYLESEGNREMLRAFIDEHRILALGGLSAVDWNEDGFPDLIGTLDGSLSVLFLNDGRGGFVRRELPVKAPSECGTFLLHVDLDNDGIPELASSKAIRYSGDRASCGLYVQGEDGWVLRPDAFEFENVVGLRGIAIQTIVPFDANGDGLLDLFFGVYGNNESRSEAYNLVEAHDGGDNYLFINQGGLKFREQSDARGIHGTQYTYVGLAYDFDGDGDEDLFEGNDFGPNVLWQNDGSGRFRPAEGTVFDRESAYTMGVTLSDHDDDGRPSMYVVNMSSEAGERIARIADGLSDEMRERVRTIASGNMLYTQAEDGSWFEHASMSNCAEGEWGWGALFCDLDGDGDDELFATNGFTSHSDPEAPDWDPYFWRQVTADGASMERGERSHDINLGLNFRGSYAGHQRDRLFASTEHDRERFFDLAWHLGLDNVWDGRCALPLDVDGDGDLDLVLWTLQGLRLLENRMPPRSFARVLLEAREGPPSALGARVSLVAGGKRQHDIVQIVEGFQTQVPLELHFGLGEASVIESLTVSWPSGREQEWRDLPARRRLRLIEGVSEVQVEELPAWPRESLDAVALQELARSISPGPTEGAAMAVGLLDGEGLMGVFDELRTLAEKRDDLELRLRKGGGPAGTTFVYDSRGRLRRVFREPPVAADLVPLLEGIADEPPFPELSVLTGRRELELGRPAEALGHFRAAREGDPGLASAAEGIARAQRMLGNIVAAEEAYELSIAIDPDYAIGHFNLGVIRTRTGRALEAVGAFEEALRIQGEKPETLLALAEAQIVVGSLEKAIAVLGRAIAADSERTAPHVLLGKLLGQQERLEEASAAFARALELDPDDQEAERGLRLVERLLRESR
jgi:Flp pilus assembly protein TadD